MAVSVLILSNMGPSLENPNSGLFVYNQFVALDKDEKLNVDFFYLNQDKKSGLAKLLRYPKFFVQFLMKYIFSLKKIDVIHVHFFFPLILFAYVYKLFRNYNVKLVVTFHGSDVYLYTPPSLIYRLSSYFVNEFIFVSEPLYSKFYRQVNKNIISAGILDVFNEQYKQSKEYDFIFVGHLDVNKGVSRLLALLNKIKIGRALNVAVVGSGPLQSAVEQSSCQNVTYLGSKSAEELSVLYHKSKFLINLSYNESFGLVMCEAMACGTPVIATKTDGASTQIINKKNGFLLENSDSWLNNNGVDYVTACLAISESEYQNLSCLAVESVQTHKLSVITHKLHEIYSQIVKKV
jgi:glycosyltransferase involved in cell wall biosynthesis